MHSVLGICRICHIPFDSCTPFVHELRNIYVAIELATAIHRSIRRHHHRCRRRCCHCRRTPKRFIPFFPSAAGQNIDNNNSQSFRRCLVHTAAAVNEQRSHRIVFCFVICVLSALNLLVFHIYTACLLVRILFMPGI